MEKTILEDFTNAVRTTLHPLPVKCSFDEEFHCLDYSPPFYFEDKCNEMSFGVEIHGSVEYPLQCETQIECRTNIFVVQSKEDWFNYIDLIIRWRKEYSDIISIVKSSFKKECSN